MEQKTGKILELTATALVMVGIGVAGTLYFMQQKNDGSANLLSTKLNSEIVVDFQTAANMELLKGKITSASSPDEEARLKRALAGEHLTQRTYDELFTILREAAADTRYSAFERALTVQMMGDVFFERTDNSPSFAEKYIFVGEPYANMIDTSTTDSSARVWDAMRKLHEYAIAIESTPISEYRIARWYIDEGNTGEAKKHIDAGNKILSSFNERLPDDVITTRAKAQWLKGLAMAEYGLVTGDNEVITEARAAFDGARTLLKPGGFAGEDRLYRGELIWLDFHYASILDRLNMPEDQALIASLLQEIVSNIRIRFSLTWYMASIMDGSAIAGPHMSANAFASFTKKDPIFESFIDELRGDR